MAEAEPPKKKSKKGKAAVEEKEVKQIRFRNYAPRTPELKDLCLPRITSADIEAEIDQEIVELLQAAEDSEAVLAIAPRKPNWDLKRDVERKMLVLQARTDRAVVQLIRMRIQGNKAEAKPEKSADLNDERAERDEAAFALAREVAKAGAPRASDSDDER
eukprot:TRINITY_DN5896_c0_g1_i1.p2 TRINITY_DN5896_c0_g1~~TRINITY_DN5896_c0_g1_i1.p2  ORF type:complete len:160 (+),score=67.22 TRINITY_DN5896_c0_g1_i1:79-558(+)